MLQRTFVCRSAGLFASSNLLRSANANEVRQKDIAQRLAVEKTASEYKMQPMTEHTRSSFEYKSSAKGAEVGARNEAAFMNYEEFTPKTLTGKLAMPNLVNLLTVAPIYCVILCIGCAAWGIFYWDLYCRKNYETVLIARPKELA